MDKGSEHAGNSEINGYTLARKEPQVKGTVVLWNTTTGISSKDYESLCQRQKAQDCMFRRRGGEKINHWWQRHTGIQIRHVKYKIGGEQGFEVQGMREHPRLPRRGSPVQEGERVKGM